MVKEHKFEIFSIVTLIVFTLWILLHTFNGWADCNEKGGAWVKGAFLYECVEKK